MNTPLESPDLFSTLTSIVVEALRVPPTRVIPSARLFADLGAESIDMLDIRFRLEQAFGLTIEQDAISRSFGPGLSVSQVRELLTVGALAEFVERRRREAGRAA